MKSSDMTERQLLLQLVAGQAKLEAGQAKLEAGQGRLEVGQKGLNNKIDFVVVHSDKKFGKIETTLSTVQETLDEHTGLLHEHTGLLQDHTESLEELKESSAHQLDLLDTIAATTGANTSDLLTLTHRKNRLAKVHR